MEEYRLRLFFFKLIKLGITYPGRDWSNPCDVLLEDLIISPNGLIRRILGDYTNESHEYKLNGAGLKMYWRVYRDNGGTSFSVKFSGDQVSDYLSFVHVARGLVREFHYEGR